MTKQNLQTFEQNNAAEIAEAQDRLNKAASLLDYKLTFNFKSAGEEHTCYLWDLPAETLACLLDYGTRRLNDKVNSLFAANPEQGRPAYVKRVMQEALEGKLGERRAASSGNAGLRNYILTFIKAQGVPAKELESYKGATPEAIINGLYTNKSPEDKSKILAVLTKRYEESLKALDGVDLSF